MNLFAAENYYIFEDLKLFTEVQLAYNKYEIKNERYVNNNFDIEHLFINPRIALNYKINESLSSYISFSNVSREPRLKNYYDAAESSGGAIPQFKQNSDGSYDFNDPLVKPENMSGIEVGTNLISSNFNFDFNFYYMYFKNEIVANGQLDRFGQPITGNMDKTVHYGLELATTIKDNSGLELIANLNLNKNKIVSGEEYFIDSFSGNTEKIDLAGNRIGGFPNIIFNAILNYRYSNLLLQVSGKYHGKAYSDNYDSKLSEYLKKYPLFADYNDNVIDPFFVVNAQINYKLCFEPIVKDITFVLQINNIFNKFYAPYAYGKEFFPAAERNYYLGMKLEF